MAGRGMDEVPNLGNDARWENFVEKWDWGKGGYQLARFFGDVWMDYIHNVETKTGKRYPEYCHGWDVDNWKFYDDRKDRCPCCALDIKGNYRYFMNAIDVAAEEARPANAKTDWTPVRMISMPQTLFKRLQELKPVNKGFSVSDCANGAIVQIKYNKDAEAANMYSVTMDTKCYPITKEQSEYIVVQKYPDGTAKVVKGVKGNPAQFEYIRCVNSRDDMVKSLRRNNYYGESESAASSAHSFDSALSRQLSREETVAKLDAEASIETFELDMDSVFSGKPAAETPKKAVRSEEPTTKTTGKKEPYEECPSAFGRFFGTIDCFTKCDVSNECKAATDQSTPTTAAASKKVAAPVMDDDDDV